MNQQEVQQTVSVIAPGEYCDLIFCDDGTVLASLDGFFTAAQLLEIGGVLTKYTAQETKS